MALVSLFLLALGVGLLVAGSVLLVDGASVAAARLRVPPLVIGLTIVAFGTSTPELVVSVIASAAGSSAVALGNVVGSNIFNVLAIIGIAALVRPLPVRRSTTWNELPLALLAALTLVVVASDGLFDGAAALVSRSEALLLLGFFAIFLAYTASLMRAEPESVSDVSIRAWSVPVAVLAIIGGLALLVGGGRLVVDHARALALAAGVSERIVAVTIVAAGTSLPELATSVTAAVRGQTDIAVGNVVGSNIFNAWFILGVAGVVRPIGVPAGGALDLGVQLLAAALLFLFVFTGKGRQIERFEGVIFVALYAGYLGLLLMG